MPEHDRDNSTLPELETVITTALEHQQEQSLEDGTKINLTEKMHELRAENEIKFREQLEDIDKNGNIHELEHFFVTNVLSAPGSMEKIRELQGRKLLQKIMPEIRGMEHLPLNPRFHARKNALDQSFAVLGQVEQRLDHHHYHFNNPERSEPLIKLAALLNRAGMHTDNNLGSPGLQRWKNGQPIYNGYEQGSSLAMKRVLQRFNESGHMINGAAFFSEGDMLLAENLTRQHNQLQYKINRQSRYEWPHDINKRIKDWSELVYDTDALNHRLDFASVSQAHFLLGQSEIFALKNSPVKNTLMERSMHFQDRLNNWFPYFEKRMKQRTIKPLIDGHDLEMLGIADRLERESLLDYIKSEQLEENIFSRDEALLRAAEMAQKEQPRSNLQEIVEKLRQRKRRTSFRMENMQPTGRKRGEHYTVHTYQAKPIRQFGPDVEPDTIRRTLESGNYPDLESYFASQNSGQPAEDVIKDLLFVGFSNLDQIEGTVRRDPDVKLQQIQEAFAPLTRHIEVERDDGLKVVLENGYQAAEHKGEGRLHINHQRLAELMKYFRKRDQQGNFAETEEDTVNRFFEQGIVPAVGHPLLEIVNARKFEEGSTIAFQQIVGTEPAQFCGVIMVGKSPQRKNIVTSTFHRSAKEFRDDLRLYLKKIFGRDEIPQDIKQSQMQQINHALQQIKQKPFSPDQVVPRQKEAQTTATIRPEQQAELFVTFEDLKTRGFAQKEIGRLIGFFQEQKRRGQIQNRQDALQMLAEFQPGQAGNIIQNWKQRKK